MKIQPEHPYYYCHFCQNSQNEVRHMVAGPGVNICSECVAWAAHSLKQHFPDVYRDWNVPEPVDTPPS